MKKNVQQILKLTLGLLFIVGCSSTRSQNLNREPDGLFNLKDVKCELVGQNKNTKAKTDYVLETKWFSTEKDLTFVDDEGGFKGVYFDISGAGGFALYFEQGKYVVESEIEGSGVQEIKKLEALPFKVPLELTSEILVKNDLRTMHSFDLRCFKSRGFRF